jgi:hypothetical protein
MKKKVENICRSKISDNFKGIWIPKEICFSVDLTSAECFLLSIIYSLSFNEEAKKYGGCWASNSYLATIMTTSKGTIAKMLTELRKKGYIKNIKSRHPSYPDRRVITISNQKAYDKYGKGVFTQE